MDMEQLYRQVIMEHYKRPQNKGLIANADYLLVHLNNPSCGDEMNVQIRIKDDMIEDIRHEGTGCSICCSSASVMSETLKSKTVEEAHKLIQAFYKLVSGEKTEEITGDAQVYQGVSKFPARIKCATLAWKAVEQGLDREKETNNG